QAQCILHKIAVTEKELPIIPLPSQDLISYAFSVAKSVNGLYVTTMDVLVAYLLITEQQTKLLLNKKIKPEELMIILNWARMDYPDEEKNKKTPHFYGEGIGEELINGWTPETQKYTKDFTKYSLLERPLLIGREKEFQHIIETLSKKQNNNILLVGDLGVGKENMVEALAYDSFSSMLSAQLNHKRILEIMLGSFLAGVSGTGALQERLGSIIKEVSHAGNVILYIPEFQNVMGSTSFHVDLSAALLPYLRDDTIPVIASISIADHKNYIEKNPLREVFEVIQVTEPDTPTSMHMVFEKAEDIEKKEKVIISFPAVSQAVNLAKRYVHTSSLPGSAITLLEDVSHAVGVSQISSFGKTKRKIVLGEDVIKKVEQTTGMAISMPETKEKDLLLHLEDKMHERVIGQDEAIIAISEAMRRARSGLSSPTKPISFLFLGPTGVGKTETAKALAALYFGNENAMLRFDMSEYNISSSIYRLLGSPGNGHGELTEKVYDHPFSLILLDEFEKAHPDILNLFLQVLEDGRLTDSTGKTVSFADTIIIATSNAGSEYIREHVGKGEKIDKIFQENLLNTLQTAGVFKPELLNRFDGIISFTPLSPEDLKQVARLLLNSVAMQMKQQDIVLSFDEKVIQKIITEGYNNDFGARPLRRYIQDHIEDLLAKNILQEKMQAGSHIFVTTDMTNSITAVPQ
ncbi:MAG: AAA family ATPase, partial [Candidatus Levyibacteriota bacterium]